MVNDNAKKIKNIGSSSKELAIGEQDKCSQNNTNDEIQALTAVICFQGEKTRKDIFISVGCSKDAGNTQ